MAPSDERRLILLLAAVNFVNILDFMMVMPLGPFFAADLGIPSSQLGIIGGSYTLAAAVSGFAGSFFLDRFDRRSALAVSLVGLAVGTVGGALATGLPTLLFARVLAGAFGGPATSMALSILTDAIPAERRGRAMGTVMIAFSLAQIAGVPAALLLAEAGSWHTPFVATGALALAAAVASARWLPPLRAHLELPRQRTLESIRKLFGRPVTLLAYATTSLSMMAAFIVIPNIPTFVIANLGYPRGQLPWLYLAGGATSFLTLRPIGRLVDQYGSYRVGSVGVALTAFMTWVAFIVADPRVPLMIVFVFFMLANGFRNVAVSTQNTKVPAPDVRARFMSLQSTVQHLGTSAGAFLSSNLLSEVDGRLVGMERISWLSIAMMAALPFLLRAVEARVQQPQPPLPAPMVAEAE